MASLMPVHFYCPSHFTHYHSYIDSEVIWLKYIVNTWNIWLRWNRRESMFIVLVICYTIIFGFPVILLCDLDIAIDFILTIQITWGRLRELPRNYTATKSQSQHLTLTTGHKVHVLDFRALSLWCPSSNKTEPRRALMPETKRFM